MDVAHANIETLAPAQMQARQTAAHPVEQADAYQDRYMGAGEAAGATAAAEPASEPDGIRSWLLETRLGAGRASATGMDAQDYGELGLRGQYNWQTVNYGDWSLLADTRSSRGDTGVGLGSFWWGNARHRQGVRAALVNRGMPLNGQWLADTQLV